MIQNDEQLDQAIAQLGRMYRALRALRQDVAPVNVRQFALIAEGPLDEIASLEQQIKAYTGEASAREAIDRFAEAGEAEIVEARDFDRETT